MEAERLVLAALSGEIVLKSPRVRPRFERRLVRNLGDALRRFGAAGCRPPRIREARLLVGPCSSGEDLEKALDATLHTFGVHGATVAYRYRYQSLEDLASWVEDIAAGWVKGRTFAVRARRSGREPFTSLDMARIIGARLHPYSGGVDLERPQVEVYVEARGGVAYLHRGLRRGPGGLPIGVEGRALALFSGGLDSPLAAWYTAKRGVEVDLLHYVLASSLSIGDALRVALAEARRWLHGYRPRLLVVDFRGVTRLIAARVAREYRQVVLRAAMIEAAIRLAERLGYDAIATGESLGQVSSQTLANMNAVTRVVRPWIPVLRPLLGMDKEEIMSMMRMIGLYEEASRTREYCRLASGPVTTRAKPERLAEEYGKVRSEALAAAGDYVEIPLHSG